MPRLRRSDCSGPGLQRRRRGRGFEFLDENGRRIEDPQTLERLAALAIPPAWTDVWICADAQGHLQATGIDAAGRKQYLYHPDWRARRDQAKFDEMLDFARALRALRRRVNRDLRRPDLDRARVLACAVRLLDVGLFRIGSEEYATGENGSFGLATIRRQHVRLEPGGVVFDYPAKSGQRRVHVISDPQVRKVIAALRRRRDGNRELLAYREGRRWVDVRSEDVNAYLKGAASTDFSAKDFRTWNATVMAATVLATEADGATSVTARKRAASRAVKTVAHYLGNTPAVCRRSYIDPRVFDRFEGGKTIAPTLERLGSADLSNPRARNAIERAVVDLLSG